MTTSDDSKLSRAQGCLLGQLAGDSLGSLVEFQSPEEILKEYPHGISDLADGGTWNTIAGQPTDDSELALILARTLVEKGTYDEKAAWKAYHYWFESGPFDIGYTIRMALMGQPNAESQANGALMRISPLGIFGANHQLKDVEKWARLDAALTHPHPICGDANALFAMAIACAVNTGIDAQALYEKVLDWAHELNVEASLLEVIQRAAEKPPANYLKNEGWVLIAMQNALWQLMHTFSLERAVIDTVMRGGDTDTNAAICGALIGAVYGRQAVPQRWVETLINCRPTPGVPHVERPRPECFWPVDALELAEKLAEPS